jgi:hypothetical protein
MPCSEGDEISQENRQQKTMSVFGELFVSWFPVMDHEVSVWSNGKIVMLWNATRRS